MNILQNSRQHVLSQIQQACEISGRDVESVELLAVSKTHPSEVLRDMYACGQRAFAKDRSATGFRD